MVHPVAGDFVEVTSRNEVVVGVVSATIGPGDDVAHLLVASNQAAVQQLLAEGGPGLHIRSKAPQRVVDTNNKSG